VISSLAFTLALSTPAYASHAVYPAAVRLEGARDAQRFVVLGERPDGVHGDLTSEAAFGVFDPAVARFEDGRLVPVADGTTRAAVTIDGVVLDVPVEVIGAGQDPALSFRLDVEPVLTATGCNTGSCHGSARGKDGFHLSLFGYDPAGDHHSLTRQLPGRRLDLAFPATSLMLEKATAAVPHSGGRRIDPGSEPYRTLLRWIDEGAPDDPADVSTVTGIELSPPGLVLEGSDADARLVVRAMYSDGTDRDVTDLAVFRTSNAATGALPGQGLVRSGQPGEAFLTASFAAHTVGVPLTVLAEGAPTRYADPAEGFHPANWIDQRVAEKLRTLRAVPAPLCDDATFLRRVYLDVVGLLPEPEALAQFLADPRPSHEKRAAVVDELLARREFNDLLVMQWAELLKIRSDNNEVSEKAALLYFEWVRDRIGENMPVDELVTELLTASGGTFAAPQSNFYQVERDNLVLSENVAQAFFGIRMQCAQCHNHPFDRWTQDDYYGFAAFFAQVGRKGAEDPREQVIYDRRGGETRHPVSGQNAAPKFLGDAAPDTRGKDRRAVLAEWLTSPENPWFARNLANRLWAQFLGTGVVEPVDDVRVSNPPSNAALLDDLGARLVGSGWDIRDLAREILNSRTYQRAIAGHDPRLGDTRNFARAKVRRLRAETILDAVCQVTSSPEKFRGLPLGARATEIADGRTGNYFLSTFGRAPRESVCACEVSDAPSLSQALHLLNGNTVGEKVRRGALVKSLLDGGKSATEVIDELYLRCLQRSPTEEERARLLAEVEAGGGGREALEDVFWALLNSREFLFQH